VNVGHHLCRRAENTFLDRRKANIIGGSEQLHRLGLKMSDNGKRGEEGPGTGVVVKTKPKTKKPSMDKVLMLNDD